MGDRLDIVLEEARSAVAKQAEDVVHKTDSLRQLARMGVAAMAGVMAAIGLLGQTAVRFSITATAILAVGTLVILVSILIAVTAATLFDVSDLPVGLDPEVLRLAASQGLDRESLDKSRLEGLLRIHAYNRSGIDRTARRATWSLYALIAGVVLALFGFSFVLGGFIL